MIVPPGMERRILDVMTRAESEARWDHEARSVSIPVAVFVDVIGALAWASVAAKTDSSSEETP